MTIADEPAPLLALDKGDRAVIAGEASTIEP